MGNKHLRSNNVNPDLIDGEEPSDQSVVDQEDEDLTWIDKKERKEYVPSKGYSTTMHTKGKGNTDERSAFHSGIGDNDDLFVKKINHESLEMPFKYAARYKGKKKNQTMIFPEIPFQYGIHYTGEQLITDNEQFYSHRVDAYPEREIKHEVIQYDPQPVDREWEAKLDVKAKVRQETVDYAVNWTGKASIESVSGAADLFTSNNGTFIGPGPTSLWKKEGPFVKEIDNRSHCSGIIAKDFYDWDDYQGEFDFKILKATGLRNDPLAKVISNTGKLHSVPGADDDMLGFIFRAHENNKDFYLFLWESDDQIVTGLRPKSLNGYNLLTGELTSSYTHAAAEAKYEAYTEITNMSDIGVNPNTYVSGMQLSQAQLNNYKNFTKTRGWGDQHYRIYKVTNGIMREVPMAYKGNGKGWKQNWFTMNMKNSIKVRVIGRRADIYTQSYIAGQFSPDNYTLAASVNLDDGFDKGSIGLLAISQAVQFEKISITKWNDISGRVPESGWDSYDGIGEYLVSPKGSSYVQSSAKKKAQEKSGLSNPDFEITSVTGEVKDSSKGAISASRDGPIKVSTFNPPDAGEIKDVELRTSGTAFITPLQVSPETGKIIFSSVEEAFKDELRKYFNKNPTQDLVEHKLTILKPDKDWHLKDEVFTMWNSEPEIIVTKKDFTHKVYAYQGWQKILNLREEFEGLEWATFEIKPVESTLNTDYDSLELKVDEVYLRTTEWYRGTYPADIKNEGIVTDKHPVYIEIPPMPEHYIEPNTGEVMYHGHENVRFLLVQITPSTTEEVWMGFESNYEEKNTRDTTTPINRINNKPVIYTENISDRVVVFCEENPRWVKWTSGKYIGYGKVNGRRPFFRDNAGKADMINVPTDVVFIPDGIRDLRGPIIEVDDDRVEFQIDKDKDIVNFSSNFKDAYIWYTDWKSEWVYSEEEYLANTEESIVIENPVEIEPELDEYYNIDDTIIEGVEVKSNNPFIDISVTENRSKEYGFYGTYYKYPTDSENILESFQVKKIGNKIQNTFNLEEKVEKGPTVYVNGNIINPSDYEIMGNLLVLKEDYLSVDDWVQIQSYTVNNLAGEYHDTYLGEYQGIRIDDQIWFDWGYESPFRLGEFDSLSINSEISLLSEDQAPEIPPLEAPQEENMNDGFAINWKGYIKAPATGEYLFNVIVNDGFRLWVDNQLIIDQWEDNMFNEFTGTIHLEGGKWYPIKANYLENIGQALVWLRWRIPGDSLRRISSEYVTPYLGYKVNAKVKDAVPRPWNPMVHNGYYYFNEREKYLYAKKIHHVMKLGKDIEQRQAIIEPRPQQASPIIVRDNTGIVLRKTTFHDESWNQTHINTEIFSGNNRKRYYLNFKDIDQTKLIVEIEGQEIFNYEWNPDKSYIEFNKEYAPNTTIKVTYQLLYSYFLEMNHNVDDDMAKIHIVDSHPEESLEGLEVIYEGSSQTPFYRGQEVVTNPLLNHNHRGFLYLTEKTNQEVKLVDVKVSPQRIGDSGLEKTVVTALIKDSWNNPISEQEVKIFRDDELIHTGITNVAGEVYYYDTPTVPSTMMSYYRVESDGINKTAKLNFFTDKKEQRSYIEMKADKSSMIANSEDQVQIYLTLRDSDWYILPSERIRLHYLDTNNEEIVESIVLNSKGQAEFTLSAEDQQNGVILLTASYQMEEENAETIMYIKVIG